MPRTTSVRGGAAAGAAEAMPDPDQATDLPGFIALLDELRRWSGRPAYRTLARRIGPLLRPPREVATSTVVDLFRPDRRRLDFDLVAALLRALGLEEPEAERWRSACVRSHADRKAGGPVGVQRQLPADLATFTGRDADLAAVLAAADCPDTAVPTVTVVAIEGMAGIGKTQLAIRAAHELRRRGRYESLQLYVNLRGFDPERAPADPADVLHAFLRQLDVPAGDVPAGRDERAAMFRDRMHDREALLVLDNAADEQQIRDLIPGGPGCLVLVTSRRSLAGLDGARLRVLDLFSPQEAGQLLTRIVGADRVAAEPAAAAAVVESAGRLPIAVALAAAKLRSRPAWTLADLAERMRDGLDATASRGRALRPLFDLSYDGLPPRARQIFQLLGLHPGADFTAESAAALAGVPPRAAVAALDLLYDEHLLVQRNPSRYEMHDLLRTYCLELADGLPNAVRAAAVERVGHWYLHAVYQAAEILYPPKSVPPTVPAPPHLPVFADAQAALDWCDAEREVLADMVVAAAGLGSDAVAWQTAVNLMAYRLIRDWHQGVELSQRTAQAAAERLADPVAQARILDGLAAAYRSLGRSADAEAPFRTTLALYRSCGDRTGEAAALINLGVVLEDVGRYADGMAATAEALLIAEDLGDRRLQATAAMNLGVAHYRRLGAHERALELYLRALALATGPGGRDTGLLAKVHGNIADIHRARGEIESALAHDLRKLEVARAGGLRVLEGYALQDIGDELTALGQPAEGRRRWRQSLEVFEDLGETWSANIAAVRERLARDPAAGEAVKDSDDFADEDP